MRLNSYEARILKDKIINKCCIDGNDNLFSYILKNDSIDIADDFFDMRDTVDSFPDNLKRVYNLAYDFSEWAHLMNTYYRYAFYQKKNNEKAEDAQKVHIEEILLEKHYPSRDRLEEILQYVETVPFFNDVNGLCQFCRDAGKYLGDKNKENELINLITKREKTIKHNHYKIGNEKYKKIDFSDLPGYYTYRWNEIVYSMINDIRNPYDYER